MPKAFGEKSGTAWGFSPVKPLEDASGRAWKASGRARDKKDLQIPMKTLTWSLVVALLALVGFGSHLAPYDTVIRCLVAAAAIDLMTYAIHNRHHSIAPVSTGIAILYYPVRSLFTFAGNWQRMLVAPSAAPSIAPLSRRDLKEAHIE